MTAPKTRAPDPPEASRAPEGAQRDDLSTYSPPDVLGAPVADDREARLYYSVQPPVDPRAWRPCATCHGEVAWSLLSSGSRLLVERDGTPHARRCEVPV